MGWAEHIASMEETRTTYTIPVGRPEGKSTLERPGADVTTVLFK
jgi:hypothetical protein